MKKKKILIFIMALVLVIALAFATSYALFRLNITNGKNFKLKVGSLSLAISDTVTENRIIIDGLIPTKDEDALAANGYNFTLTNTGTIDSSFKIYLDDIFPSEETRARLNNDLVKVNLSEYGTINNSNTIRLSDSNDRMILTGILKAGRSQQYTLRIWLDHSAGNSEQNKYFASQLRIEGQQFNEVSLRNKILDSYQVLETTPNFTVADTTNNTGKIFKSTDTNSGKPTYYFRGVVNDNYVKFANKMWRIVRINEDNTIRLVLEDYITDGTETGKYKFNSTGNALAGMYYSTSDVAKPTVDAWYQDNIASNYDEYVSSGEYFCEEARVTTNTQAYKEASLSHDNLELEAINDYIPSFRCNLDSYNKGPMTGKVGLLTLDEVLYAGTQKSGGNNTEFYLNIEKAYWLSSPAGYNGSDYIVWRTDSFGGRSVNSPNVEDQYFRTYRPVINLKDGVIVTGTGTQADPYTVQPKRNYADTEAILASFNKNTLKEAVVCTNSNGVYTDCAVYPTLEAAIASRNDSVIILTSDITRTDTLNIASNKTISLDLNGYKIEKNTTGEIINLEGNLTINDTVGTGKIVTTSNSNGVNSTGNLVVNNGTIETAGNGYTILAGTSSNAIGTVTINGGTINSKRYGIYIYTSEGVNISNATIKSEGSYYCIYGQGSQGNISLDGVTLISENGSGIVHKSSGVLTINDSKIYAVNSGANNLTWKYGVYNYGTGIVNVTGNTIIENKGINTDGQNGWTNIGIANHQNANGAINITGTQATFDTNGKYQSGIYIKSNTGRVIYSVGQVKVNGAFLESKNNVGVEMISSAKNLLISNSTIKSSLNAINSATTGSVKVCNTSITSTGVGSYDLSNTATGSITYNNVTFSNGTTTPAPAKISNTGGGTVGAGGSNTCATE